MLSSIFSAARIGSPAATRPTTGMPPCMPSGNLIPRDVPGVNTIAPFFAKAFRCSSAALGDLNPSF